jgi:hypothetical protein
MNGSCSSDWEPRRIHNFSGKLLRDSSVTLKCILACVVVDWVELA